MLTQSGCGAVFLSAITNTLKFTRSVKGDRFFDATAGVHQGGSTSCSLFTFYINMTIRKIAEFGFDGFLGLVHCLLLMDDTVIFATSRRSMQRKFYLRMEATNQTNMTMYPTKSKYFAVNTGDREPFILGNAVISYRDLFVYLGSPMKKQVANHAATKQCHIRKFSSFLAKNFDSPFVVKKVVWESALSTAILYSFETWMVKDITAV